MTGLSTWTARRMISDNLIPGAAKAGPRPRGKMRDNRRIVIHLNYAATGPLTGLEYLGTR